MDELKELLGEELFNQVKDKLGDKKLLIDDGGKYIPYSRFAEVTNKNKQLQEQLSKYEQDLNSLKASLKNNDELVSKIKEIEEQNKKLAEEFQKKELTLSKKLALKELLLNEGVIDEDARDLLLNKFDIEKIEIDNGKVKNAEELLKPIKSNKVLSSLFGKPIYSGKSPAPNSGDQNQYFTKEQVDKMSPEEVSKNYEQILISMKNW